MKTNAACQGRQCQIEQGLPFAGPVVALGMMFLVVLVTPVAMMIG